VSSITASGGGVFIDQNPFPSVGREEIALLKRGPRGRDAAVHAQTHLVKKNSPSGNHAAKLESNGESVGEFLENLSATISIAELIVKT